jgi:uncharacterized membrane protein
MGAYKKNKAAWIVSLIFVIHILGLVHTQNKELGFLELKVKLPLLLPVFYFSSEKLLKDIRSDFFIFAFYHLNNSCKLFQFYPL